MERKVFLRAPFNYDADQVSAETGITCDGPGAQQQFKDECDINTIVERFGLTGQLPDDYRVPISGDFTGISDYHSAMNAVRQAEEAFMELPGDLRARFDHDPGKLIAFCEDGRNLEEARRLGLVPMPAEVHRDEAAAAVVPGSGGGDA